MHILEPTENHEDETEAYEKAINLINEHPDLKGLYVSTANSAPVLKAPEDSGALKKVTVITTDLFPALIKYIESGGSMLPFQIASARISTVAAARWFRSKEWQFVSQSEKSESIA